MITRDYSITSPSLGGFLTHESLMYEGIRKPVAVLRAHDGPAARIDDMRPEDEKVLEQYFYDLYGVFIKRLSQLVVGSDSTDSDTIKLQAMLQEMIKIKKLIVSSRLKS